MLGTSPGNDSIVAPGRGRVALFRCGSGRASELEKRCCEARCGAFLRGYGSGRLGRVMVSVYFLCFGKVFVLLIECVKCVCLMMIKAVLFGICNFGQMR